MFSNRYSNGGNSFLSSIPPVTRHLIIINVLVYVAGILMPKLGNIMEAKLALYYWGSGLFNPVQMFTSMFLHGSITHLFFNMFALFMFGRLVESVWGHKRFLLFYFVCGVGAALVQELVTMWQLHHLATVLNSMEIDEITRNGLRLFNDNLGYTNPTMLKYQLALYTPCVGASGAIFGVLMGFAFLFPNLPMYIWFIPIPIKAKWMVLGYAVIEFFAGVGGAQDGVAHFAHLGGLLFGLVVMYVWYGPSLFRGGARQM